MPWLREEFAAHASRVRLRDTTALQAWAARALSRETPREERKYGDDYSKQDRRRKQEVLGDVLSFAKHYELNCVGLCGREGRWLRRRLKHHVLLRRAAGGVKP